MRQKLIVIIIIIEDHYIGVLSHTFYSNFCRDIVISKIVVSGYHCTRFCKIVVVSKQVKNVVVVLAFFDQQKGSVTSNKDN